MSTLTPSRPAPIVPDFTIIVSTALISGIPRSGKSMYRRPCPGCGRVWCTCPRKDWFTTLAAAAKPALSPTVQPGKGTRPPAGGGVHPPAPGWGGKKR